MTLADLFAQSLVVSHNKVGLEWNGRTFTFGDLDERATRTARTLTARGLSAGDRLAVYLPNRIDVIDLFLACTRLGVIVVPVNVLYREREISHILSDAEPKAIVAAGTPPGTYTVPVWQVDDLANDAAQASTRPIDRGAVRARDACRDRVHLRHDGPGERRDSDARQSCPECPDTRRRMANHAVRSPPAPPPAVPHPRPGQWPSLLAGLGTSAAPGGALRVSGHPRRVSRFRALVVLRRSNDVQSGCSTRRSTPRAASGRGCGCS